MWLFYWFRMLFLYTGKPRIFFWQTGFGYYCLGVWFLYLFGILFSQEKITFWFCFTTQQQMQWVVLYFVLNLTIQLWNYAKLLSLSSAFLILNGGSVSPGFMSVNWVNCPSASSYYVWLTECLWCWKFTACSDIIHCKTVLFCPNLTFIPVLLLLGTLSRFDHQQVL